MLAPEHLRPGKTDSERDLGQQGGVILLKWNPERKMTMSITDSAQLEWGDCRDILLDWFHLHKCLLRPALCRTYAGPLVTERDQI